jgi:transcriptional regulator with XRE-family HTH domain
MDEQSRYALQLGDRLRNVRQQQGMSLHDVEVASEGELKASVVGAYERGERAISVTRLRSLADFYNVPIAQLLPGRDARAHDGAGGLGLRIDLTRIEQVGGTEMQLVERYLSAIQARRGDYNGRVLTVRSGDVSALAAVLDMDAADLRDELVGAGVASETR